MYLMGFPVAAAGVAVELGEHDAVDAEGLVKRGGGVHGILSGHGVHDQQDLVRLHRRLDALELVHELLVDVQAAGGIEKDDVVAVVLGVFDGLDRDGDGVDLPHLEHGQAELCADDLQLRDGRGTVHVAGGEQRALALLFEQTGELCAVRGLACALQADEHNDRRRLGGDGNTLIFAAHQTDELFVDDLDHLLGGGEAVEHLGADGALGNSGDKVLDDFVAHVCLEQRHAHLAHRELDVLLGQAALAAQALEYAVELFAQALKCHEMLLLTPCVPRSPVRSRSRALRCGNPHTGGH